MRIRHVAAASRSCQKLTESCLREATWNRVRKYIQFSDHWYFWMLLLESYSSRSKQFRNTKIGIQSAKGLSRPHPPPPPPLPLIYTYSTGASDYTCHPNIHHLLFSWVILSYITSFTRKQSTWKQMSYISLNFLSKHTKIIFITDPIQVKLTHHCQLHDRKIDLAHFGRK